MNKGTVSNTYLSQPSVLEKLNPYFIPWKFSHITQYIIPQSVTFEKLRDCSGIT